MTRYELGNVLSAQTMSRTILAEGEHGEVSEQSEVLFLEVKDNVLIIYCKGDEMLNGKSEHIKINGHRGTWYVIDSTNYKGKDLYLLEHETYGDMAMNLIVDKDRNLLMSDVSNGFDDYYEMYEGFEDITLADMDKTQYICTLPEATQAYIEQLLREAGNYTPEAMNGRVCDIEDSI